MARGRNDIPRRAHIRARAARRMAVCAHTCHSTFPAKPPALKVQEECLGDTQRPLRPDTCTRGPERTHTLIYCVLY